MAETANKKLVGLDNLLVHRGRPDNDNPFRGMPFQNTYPVTAISGGERIRALHAFHEKRSTTDYTFWSVVRGDVREITDPADVDWSYLR